MSLPETLPSQTAPAFDPAAVAGAVAALKASAHMLQQSLVAVNGLPGVMEQQLQEFKAEFETSVTIPLQKRMADIEAKQRDSILITPLQQEELKEAIADRAKELGTQRVHFSRMYGRLHREFGIPKYNYLRAVDFDLAMKFIKAYDGSRSTWPVPKSA